MRLILLVSVLLMFFSSCTDTEDILRSGWDAFDAGQYEVAAGKFDTAMLRSKHRWDRGYAQKCTLLKGLYYLNKIPKKMLYDQVYLVYQQWFKHNPEDTEHLVPYAGLLYLMGGEMQYRQLLERAYNPDHVYNFDPPTTTDMWNAYAGVALGKVEKEVFKDTVFMPSHSESEIEDCEGECSMFDLDEWEMIDLFVGN